VIPYDPEFEKCIKGKPKIPLDTIPILGYFPAIGTRHFF
jgi:hypothetical protein